MQVLYEDNGDPIPLLGAVGQMQFEVFVHRLVNEFGARLVRLHTTIMVGVRPGRTANFPPAASRRRVAQPRPGPRQDEKQRARESI